MTLELHGELARIIAMTVGNKNQRAGGEEVDQVSVVAGARNHLNLLLGDLLLSDLQPNY